MHGADRVKEPTLLFKLSVNFPIYPLSEGYHLPFTYLNGPYQASVDSAFWDLTHIRLISITHRNHLTDECNNELTRVNAGTFQMGQSIKELTK